MAKRRQAGDGMVRKRDDGRWEGRMTLGEWLDCWITEYKEGTIRPSTLTNYRRYAAAAAANIDRGIGKAAPQEDASEPGQENLPRPRRKSRV